MAAKEILFDVEAKNKILAGVDTLANAVRVTLGPAGRNGRGQAGEVLDRVDVRAVVAGEAVELGAPAGRRGRGRRVATRGTASCRPIGARTALRAHLRRGDGSSQTGWSGS